MLKRIAIYCIGFLSAGLLVLGYFWLKEWPERAKASRESGAFLAEETAQKSALESLGDVNLDLSDLSLARLEQKLHAPSLKLPGARNTIRLGWACGGQRCAIWMSFLVPFGQEIAPTVTPAALVIADPLFADFDHVVVGGAYVGETVEEMKKFCRQRGYGLPVGKNRITWDKDWSLLYADTNGKIGLLSFANEKMIKDNGDRGAVNSTGAAGKGMAK
ncbi:MAG TPA: hypothetical protein VNX28_12085 [Gemmataceae bacterium]|jgi:hypothetical protein|nr:hypothetical protein [Gemmataceae bacterium]